jgi:ferredoxin
MAGGAGDCSFCSIEVAEAVTSESATIYPAAKKLLAQAETDSDQRLRERALEIHKRLAANQHLGL